VGGAADVPAFQAFAVKNALESRRNLGLQRTSQAGASEKKDGYYLYAQVGCRLFWLLVVGCWF
jgi:hypothetical protein